jgi:hypothetical protein
LEFPLSGTIGTSGLSDGGGFFPLEHYGIAMEVVSEAIDWWV